MLLLVVLVLIVVALVLVKHVRDMRALKDYPPGPTRWPVVGSLLSTPGQLIHLHADKHWRPKYGPLVGLTSGGGRRMLVVCGGEEVLAVLNNDLCQARPVGFAFTERSFGKPLGIMFSSGPYWTSQRRFILRQLRDLGLGKSMLEGVVLNEVDAILDAMTKEGPVLQPNKLFNAPVLNVLWWMVSGKAFARGVGASLDPQSQRLLDIMNRAMRNKRMGTAPCDIWPILKHIAPDMSAYNEIYQPIFEMQAYIREEIKAQRQNGVEESLIGKYTQEIEKGEPGSFFTDESLIIACLDLFMAGGESTANTLSFCLLYMAMYPEKQAKVHEQLDEHYGDPGKVVTLSDKPSLPYVEAALFETMRINTIGPLTIPHSNVEDIEMNGYVIPKNTIMMLSLWSVLNDKKHWGDPEVFRPERFLDKDGRFVRDPWMVPFSAGKRVCIGENFALHVAFLFFANMLNRFKFSFPPGTSLPSTIPEAGFTVAPKPFTVIAEPRGQRL